MLVDYRQTTEDKNTQLAGLSYGIDCSVHMAKVGMDSNMQVLLNITWTIIIDISSSWNQYDKLTISDMSGTSLEWISIKANITVASW